MRNISLVVIMCIGLCSGMLRANEQLKHVFDGIPFPAEQTPIQLMNDNVDAWYARWNMIMNAKSTIDVVYFILEPDVYGKAFLGMLLKKALKGVRVRILIDGRGSLTLSGGVLADGTGGHAYLEGLVDAGAEVAVFNPIFSNVEQFVRDAVNDQQFDVRRLIASNHDKIIVVDGELTLTGGRNIQNLYLMSSEEANKIFRDTDVLMKGSSLANSLTTAIEEELANDQTVRIAGSPVGGGSAVWWFLPFCVRAMDAWIKGDSIQATTEAERDYVKELEKLTASREYLNFRPFRTQHEARVKIFDNHSILGEKNEITKALIEMIDATEHELIIQNPYVTLTDEAKASLQRANDRGVKIIIHTNSPASTDSLPTQAFFLDDWIDLLKSMRNLEIWVYTSSELQLHAKVFVFDKKITAIGTYNMDYLSDRINSEVIAFIDSDSFSNETANQILNVDLPRSKQYKIEILPDGGIRVIYGPMMTIEQRRDIQLGLELIRKAKFLKPLI